MSLIEVVLKHRPISSLTHSVKRNRYIKCTQDLIIRDHNVSGSYSNWVMWLCNCTRLLQSFKKFPESEFLSRMNSYELQKDISLRKREKRAAKFFQLINYKEKARRSFLQIAVKSVKNKDEKKQDFICAIGFRYFSSTYINEKLRRLFILMNEVWIHQIVKMMIWCNILSSFSIFSGDAAVTLLVSDPFDCYIVILRQQGI